MRAELLERLCDLASSRPFCDDGPFDVTRLLDHARLHAARRLDAGHALFSALILADWWDRWLGFRGRAAISA